MINVQNEIKYVIAWNMLQKLLMSGFLSSEEYEKAHSVIAGHYAPLSVRR